MTEAERLAGELAAMLLGAGWTRSEVIDILSQRAAQWAEALPVMCAGYQKTADAISDGRFVPAASR